MIRELMSRLTVYAVLSFTFLLSACCSSFVGGRPINGDDFTHPSFPSNGFWVRADVKEVVGRDYGKVASALKANTNLVRETLH
jgi:hypothetical protein